MPIKIRPAGEMGSYEVLEPSDKPYKVRLKEITEEDNPFYREGMAVHQAKRLRFTFEGLGKHEGKVISKSSTPSMNSQFTKTIITGLFGREPTPDELANFDPNVWIEEAEKAGRNRFLVKVVGYTKANGQPGAKVDSVLHVPEDED